MPGKAIWGLAMLLTVPAAFAESDLSDAVVTRALLGEVRQLRQDLQATAAMIQRVQIAMYRLQRESAQLDNVKQRLEGARNQCEQVQQQEKWTAARIEQAEATRRDAVDPGGRKSAETSLAQLKSSLEMWTGREQTCKMEQVEAETQVRTEQAKVDELQDQLDKFDKLFSAYLQR